MKKFKKVYIEITNICNKSCSFCSKTNRPLKEMTVKEFERVLKQIKPYTEYVYLHVKGEPLLHTKFEEILSLCEKNEIKVNITTNGSLLKKKEGILKKYSCIRQLNISLHSIESKEELENIIVVVENLLKETYMNIVYRFWIMNQGKMKPKDHLFLEKIKQYYSYEEEKQNIKLKERLYINKQEEFIWPSLNNEKIGNTGFCYALKDQIAILSDGKVVPCCLDAEGIIELGNLLEQDLESILKCVRTTDLIKSFQNNILKEELCKRCSFHLSVRKKRESWKNNTNMV